MFKNYFALFIVVVSLVACSKHEITSSTTVINNSQYVVEAYAGIALKEGSLGASCNPKGAIIPEKVLVLPGEKKDLSVTQKCDSSIGMTGEVLVSLSKDLPKAEGESVQLTFKFDQNPYLKDISQIYGSSIKTVQGDGSILERKISKASTRSLSTNEIVSFSKWLSRINNPVELSEKGQTLHVYLDKGEKITKIGLPESNFNKDAIYQFLETSEGYHWFKADSGVQDGPYGRAYGPRDANSSMTITCEDSGCVRD